MRPTKEIWNTLVLLIVGGGGGGLDKKGLENLANLF